MGIGMSMDMCIVPVDQHRFIHFHPFWGVKDGDKQWMCLVTDVNMLYLEPSHLQLLGLILNSL